MLRPFLIALQFLTRTPLRLKRAPVPDELGRSLPYYPLVGALIGIVLWLIARLGHGFDLADAALAALLLAVLTVASGGLHLEGLADSSDGWAASHRNPQRALEVMRDPHCGPFAVIAVTLVLICKFGALQALVAAPDGASFGALLAAPMLARATVIALYATTPYVRPHGIGAELAQHQQRRHGLFALLACAFATLLACGVIQALALLALAATVCYGARHLMLRTIGGATGDATGATIELTETAVLLGAAFFLL